MNYIREQVALMMEHNGVLTKLNGKKWYDVEDAICQLITQILGIKEEDALFSKCDKASCDDDPTLFEEKIYRKVDRYYHKLDILSVIDDDQEQRNWEGVPRLVYTCQDIDAIVNNYENNLTGELQLAHDTLKDYQDTHVFEEIV